jgi:hypothetical protein
MQIARARADEAERLKRVAREARFIDKKVVDAQRAKFEARAPTNLDDLLAEAVTEAMADDEDHGGGSAGRKRYRRPSTGASSAGKATAAASSSSRPVVQVTNDELDAKRKEAALMRERHRREALYWIWSP